MTYTFFEWIHKRTVVFISRQQPKEMESLNSIAVKVTKKIITLTYITGVTRFSTQTYGWDINSNKE